MFGEELYNYAMLIPSFQLNDDEIALRSFMKPHLPFSGFPASSRRTVI